MRRDYTNMDPDDAVNAYLLDEADELAQRPKCADCREPIMEDYAFEVDGSLICQECMEHKVKYLY